MNAKISFTLLPPLWFRDSQTVGGWGHLLDRALVHLESRFPEGPGCCIGPLTPESVFFPTAGWQFTWAQMVSLWPEQCLELKLSAWPIFSWQHLFSDVFCTRFLPSAQMFVRRLNEFMHWVLLKGWTWLSLTSFSILKMPKRYIIGCLASFTGLGLSASSSFVSCVPPLL